MMGSIALGVPTAINPLERNNRWFRKQISEELHRIQPRAKLPTSLLVLVKILMKLWPEWVADGRKKMDNHYRQPSGEEQRSTVNFIEEFKKKNSKFVKVSQDRNKPWYAFKQKSSPIGPLYDIDKRTVLSVIKSWAKEPTQNMT